MPNVHDLRVFGATERWVGLVRPARRRFTGLRGYEWAVAHQARVSEHRWVRSPAHHSWRFALSRARAVAAAERAARREMDRALAVQVQRGATEEFVVDAIDGTPAAGDAA